MPIVDRITSALRSAATEIGTNDDPEVVLAGLLGHAPTSAQLAREGLRLAFTAVRTVTYHAVTFKAGLDHFDGLYRTSTALLAAHDAQLGVLVDLVAELHPAGREEVLRRVTAAKREADQAIKAATVASATG